MDLAGPLGSLSSPGKPSPSANDPFRLGDDTGSANSKEGWDPRISRSDEDKDVKDIDRQDGPIIAQPSVTELLRGGQ